MLTVRELRLPMPRVIRIVNTSTPLSDRQIWQNGICFAVEKEPFHKFCFISYLSLRLFRKI